MPDDTTIIDSENFSMVSVDSLPSISALSSPPNGNAGTTPVARNLTSALEEDRLRVPPADIRKTRSSPRVTTKPSPRPLEPLVKASPTPVRRYITPTVDSHPLSNPPPIVPAHSSLSEVETPRIGRVVRAGVALQGVLDPERLTPQAGSSKQALDKKRDHLDDLFRGFSEGTRRDLQAGLRLGEQLAQQRQANAQSSPALSSPIKTNPSASVDDVFYPSIKNQKSRLPTPEDADYVSPSPPPPTHATEVHYPSLNVEQQAVHLVSPARSSTGSAAEAGHTPPIRAISAEGRRFMTVVNEQGQELRGAEILVVADEDEQAEDDYSDIWQEEASRSSDEPGIDQPAAPVGTERSPQLQDLFSDEGPVKPTRGKLPRTWRRKSSSDFHYSDEVEEPQQETPSSTESDHSPPTRMDKGKAKVVEPIPEEQSAEDEGDLSDASDDTGLFFQSNMPTLFNHRRSTEIRKKRAEKLDLSLLMQEGESLLLESSPPPAFKTPSAPTPNPFKNTPPRFAALHTSPAKSSPLRKEIWASESASDSFHQYQDESTLPLPASSPFHTYVEGDSMVSTASDQQQFRVEMEGGTDPSLRRLRNQADDYLDAYSLQDRTLNEIEEVTEPSRTLNKQTSMMNSSPSKTRERSVLEPKRTYAPLFSSETTTKNQKTAAQKRQSVGQAQKAAVVALPTEQPSSGIFGRLTSSLWSVLGNPTPPPSHPAIADFDRLPKVQPWTKTHYKTLDRLYQLHKKQPTLFAPSSASSTSNTNNSLLTQFFTGAQKPFLGAKYSSWGYSATMTEPLIVLCAVYMQLLTLSGVTEYEKLSGKEIEMGDCNPASWAKPIDHEEVVRRLASIVMGEDLRRDERRGKEIHRVGGLTIEWPH
ncbi:hypothetical protein BDV95DRAFT_583064 [Massariosphaeria phaeospora]|uniref:Uncharacterized protein n=1 Tax=Massariosphaeria phaeospora TaxID=100035 RepID=A0A7C8MGZ1_9PLEO|nr:hypothetical protein BDV95DRAFT_583064 [Massariosphaeria phaeospora]